MDSYDWFCWSMALYLKCNQCKSHTSASLVSVPGRVCWSGVWAHGPPSSGCLDDRWPSRAGHQPSPGCFLCAAWCVACRCESQTCDTRRTSTGPSPGPTQTDSLTEPLLSPEHLLPVCRWSSLIRLQQAERNHVSFGCSHVPCCEANGFSAFLLTRVVHVWAGV